MLAEKGRRTLLSHPIGQHVQRNEHGRSPSRGVSHASDAYPTFVCDQPRP